MHSFLDSLTLPSLTEDQQTFLDSLFTKEEVHAAILSSPNIKTPGPDGFSVDYYKLLVSELTPHLTSLYNGVYQRQTLVSLFLDLRKTLILKPKKDDTLPQSYRPISLLNNDYAFLTKILATRMQSFLPIIIHLSQRGFVKHRQSVTNIR